ncbi:hypothetical protein, partial [Clostridioides difficile]|uniref:hypothetical protein n=1 Tax=Clostridioides difficile TaxID=1496 RepID=UPI002FD4E3F0
MPMLVAIIAPGNVTVVALARLLGLAHGIGPALDRQIAPRLRCRARRFITLRASLPLAVLAGALYRLVLRARLAVFRPPLTRSTTARGKARRAV